MSLTPGKQFGLMIGLEILFCILAIIVIVVLYQQSYKKRTNEALAELEKIKL